MQLVTEIITHFIGLFRVLDEPSRTWVKPDGAGSNHSILLDHDHADQGHRGADPVQALPSPPFIQRDAPSDPDPHLHGWKGSLQHLPDLPLAPILPHPFDPSDAPALGGGGGGIGAVTTVTATVTTVIGSSIVWHGADQTVVDDHQTNFLVGNTSYVDHPGAGPLPMPSDALLPGMIAQSFATAPWGLPVLAQSDTQEISSIKDFGGRLANGSLVPLHNLHEGTYTDGALTSSDGTPGTLTLPVNSLSTTMPTANGVPLGQTIIMGHDIAGNVALIVDTSAAPLTQIVQGNAFHADIIIQSNVVQNIDQVSVTASAFASGSILSDGNVIHNTVHFDQLPGTVSTNVTGSFAQHWNVHVTAGDFYDINAITQQNVLINDTLYAGTPMTDHYYAVLGGDTQLNQASFTHDAPSYDLLIVLGNSYCINAIYQNNVLLNDTKTGVEVSTSNDGTNTILAGHNTVTNDASILEIGTHQWNPSTAEIQALVHDLSTNGDFTGSLPGLASFGGTINVQLVTGNYYDLNLIQQTNIVANSSITLADLTKAGFQVPTNVTVGQNTLTNSAAIATAGPLGDQYVGGKPYETSMLVQSNIVTTHTESSGGPAGAFVPELVAFLDPANVPHVTGPGDAGHSTLPASSTAQQDVLAGHLH